MRRAPCPSRRRFILSTTAAACILFLAGAARADPTPTPQALVAELIAAARANDLPRYQAALTADSRQGMVRAIKAMAQLEQANTAFQTALDARFGTSGRIVALERSDTARELQRLAGAEVIGVRDTADGAAIRVRTRLTGDAAASEPREETVFAILEREDWRLVLGFASTPDLEARLRDLDRVTGKVAADGYADRLEAMVAADNAIRGRRTP